MMAFCISSQYNCLLLTAFIMLLLGASGGPTDIKYFTESSVAVDWDLRAADTLALHDSINGDSLYKVSTLNGSPRYYYQEVSTNVCFDNKCRPIRVKVYWNITGRYWGFSLENEEFLSRREHEPFEVVDYERLHLLMSDPFLPFNDVTFEELIEEASSNIDQVDGITGATSKQLSAYVVEGAAYTTYVLWHRIYGANMDLIRRTTESELSSDLLVEILHSPVSADKIWGLGKVDPTSGLDQSLEKVLLDIISSEEFFTSYRALDAISATHLEKATLQEGLFSIYEVADNALRNLIIDKFKMASEISQSVLTRSLQFIPGANGVQLGHWLEIYEKYGFTDPETYQVIAGILHHENRIISKKAYQFLRSLDLEDEVVLKALDKYIQGVN